MGVFLGQLPPAELARLKAELAETLIAYFCYPRFFDYRTDSLRTRPVDRAKRQEVWLFLSSVDFTTWNRVDLMSPDFQHHIERLLIHFVQRNRNFFGEQGRKRMSDIRMLIGTSAASVVKGLRGHLSGNAQNNPPFGSPRPVTSWSTTNSSGHLEPNWDKIAQATLLLQQQVQETRGESKPAIAQSEARPTTVPVQLSSSVQAKTGSGMNGPEQQPSAPTPASKPAVHVSTYTTSPLAGTKNASSAKPGQNTSAMPPAAVAKVESLPTLVNVPNMPLTSVPAPVKPSVSAAAAMPEKAARPLSPSLEQPRTLPQPQPAPASTMPGSRESATPVTTDGDLAIFEQLRHQLVIWLRVEAVRSGLDITHQSPPQLLELLRRQDGFDETRLQVVSSLLNLTNQVIKNGQAGLFDYKQALMLHLIHTRR